MPAIVRLNPSASTALVVLEGLVRWNHVAAALLSLYGRDDADPGLVVLWDGRAISDLDLPLQKVPALIALVEQLHDALDGGRSAIVVQRDYDAFMAEYIIRRGPCRRRTFGKFNELADALAFLGHPPLPLVSERVFDVG